jgi:SAM-dependent methyltransferase
MPLMQSYKRVFRACSFLPAVSPVVHSPIARRVLQKVPVIRSIYDNGWDLVHPFDRMHGTDTSGCTPDAKIRWDAGLDIHAHGYAGSQPGVTRNVLATLPGLETLTFVDLGCGKGRPLLVATEFPFKDIIGVELSPKLGDIATRNAARFAELYPDRTKVRIVVGNAVEFPIPPGDVLVYLYNPFEEEPLRKVSANVEAALAAGRRRIFVVYFHPKFSSVFDGSRALVRRCAKAVPHTRDELGYGCDRTTEEYVIIWQNGHEPLMRSD